MLKTIFKKLCVFSLIGVSAFCLAFLKSSEICHAQSQSNATESEEKEDFNFIKRNDNSVDFIYDGTILLYGGITLVAVSIAGMIITVIPKKK